MRIHETLRYISEQNYEGIIKVLVVDNNSTNDTIEKAKSSSRDLKMLVRVIKEKEVGKFNALNAGLKIIDTDLRKPGPFNKPTSNLFSAK